MSQLKQADQQQLDKRLICSLSQCTDESLNPDVSEISLREIVCWPEGKWNSRCSLSNTISWPDLERPRNRRRLLLIASASVVSLSFCLSITNSTSAKRHNSFKWEIQILFSTHYWVSSSCHCCPDPNSCDASLHYSTWRAGRDFSPLLAK